MPVPVSDPYEIFARARARLEAARYPAQVSYTVAVTATRRGITSTAHYHVYYDSTTGAVHVLGVSDEELAHPYTPHGINTSLNLFGGKGIPLSAPQQTFDLLGVPVLAPNYFFGVASYVPQEPGYDAQALVNEIRREFHEPPKNVTGTAERSLGLKTIASVETAQHDYVMHLDGEQIVDGHNDYHLLLQPLRDPDRYRLRDLWIDTQNFALDRLVTQGNFSIGGVTGVAWTTTFHEIGGAPYISSESTVQSFAIFRHGYDSATVAFENISASAIPGYVSISAFAVNQDTGMPPLVEPP